MPADLLTWRDFARFARMSPDEVARDCEVSAFHASGPGGQGVNTSDSAVRMRHLPTGITVTSREQRSQLQNRQECLRKLHRRFEERAHPPKPRKRTHPTKGSVERRLDAKRRRSDTKGLRRRPHPDD